MDPTLGKTVLYAEDTAAENAPTVVEGHHDLDADTTFTPVQRGVPCGARVTVLCASGRVPALVELLDISSATLHMPYGLPHLSPVAITLPLPRSKGPTEGRAIFSKACDDGGCIVEVTFVNVDETRRDDLAKVVQALRRLSPRRNTRQ
jgi:hypothetical protein